MNLGERLEEIIQPILRKRVDKIEAGLNNGQEEVKITAYRLTDNSIRVDIKTIGGDG